MPLTTYTDNPYLLDAKASHDWLHGQVRRHKRQRGHHPSLACSVGEELELRVHILEADGLGYRLVQ